MMNEKQKRMNRMEFCETIFANRTKHELTHPAEIAEHIAASYNLTFNKQFKSERQVLLDYMGQDMNKL